MLLSLSLGNVYDYDCDDDGVDNKVTDNNDTEDDLVILMMMMTMMLVTVKMTLFNNNTLKCYKLSHELNKVQFSHLVMVDGYI